MQKKRKSKKKNSGEDIINDYIGENGENPENNETFKIDEEKKKEEKKIKEPKRKNSKKSKKEKADKEKDYILNVEDDEEKKSRPLLFKGKDGEDEDEEKDINLLSILKFSLKSKRLIFFGAIVLLQAPVPNMAFTLYREIGKYNKINIKYLQLVGSFILCLRLCFWPFM